MSKPKNPKKVKCIIAIFSNDIDILNKAENDLIKKYGKLDFKSDDLDFTETTYYNKEMGNDLKIRFLSFAKRITRSSLPSVKLYSNRLEKKYSINSKRRVNIDPGLLSLENFILATGKPYSHRIYLNRGIWAEVTLIYKKEDYTDLPWTYPNYKSKKVKDILLQIRKIYHGQMKNEK